MPSPASPPPGDVAGASHERELAASGRRKALGAYYTPLELVGGVLDLALDPVLARAAAEGPAAVRALRVVDPACGSGRFLVAAGERILSTLLHLGEPEAPARAAATRCLHGVDLDPGAVRLARAAVRDLGGGDVDGRAVARRIVAGDALAGGGALRPGAFDVVVGNPPFLSQLDAATARSAGTTTLLRQRFGDVIGPYTDPAAAFLLLGTSLVHPGGVVALVEPVAALTARDAGSIRAALTADAALVDLWLVGRGAFDAAVEVCVPVLVATGGGGRAGAGRTRLHRGLERSPAGDAPSPSGPASWSPLLAALDQPPPRTLQTDGVLGDLATATADFRDQYYGLAPHVVDAADAPGGADRGHPPLVTVGLIDPGRLRWGERTTRFNKVRRLHPRVDLAALPPTLRAWAGNRLVPKVLLATQTRILEAVADPDGRLLPSVPVISVVPVGGEGELDPLAVWRIAVVLTCPSVALLAVHRHLGSGRNARALRLRAAEVLDLPLPADRQAWDGAAALLRRGAPLEDVGRAMDLAYGLVGDDELLAWWVDRLPTT